MGAFDGFVSRRGYYPDVHDIVGSISIKGQPSFYLSKYFTLNDLIQLVKDAEKSGKDHVWMVDGLPHRERRCDGNVRLDLWYAKALVEHLLTEESE